jgi:predicted phage terminase large subunit-like protein
LPSDRDILRRIGQLERREEPRGAREVTQAPEARRLASSFPEFVRAAWPHADPSEFVPAWHIDAMAERLQALHDGEIPNLLILVPPGMAKSLVASVLYPCWAWARDPSERFLCSAHAQTISVRDTIRGRNVLRSPWYRALWPNVRLVADQDTKARYTNTAGGWRVATSAGSQVTGERASTIIVDDPVDLMAAYHPEQIARAVDHYNTALTSRGTGERTKRVIIAQRVAYRDLASEVLEQTDRGGEPFDLLLLPMRYSPTFRVVLPSGRAIGADQLRHDERRPGGAREGEELLFPELYPEHIVGRLEVAYGDRAGAILQQSPTQHRGQVFRRSTFGEFYVDDDGQDGNPAYLFRDDVRSRLHSYRELDCAKFITVDLAASTSESADFFVAQVWAVTPGSHLLLLDQVRGRYEGPDQPGVLWEMYHRWRPSMVCVEASAYQLTLAQRLEREGMPVKRVRADRDKRARASVAATLMAEGRVYFRAYPRAEWLGDLEDELASFPGGPHDDQVDALSYAAQELVMGEVEAPKPSPEPAAVKPHGKRASRPFGPFRGGPPFESGAPFGPWQGVS